MSSRARHRWQAALKGSEQIGFTIISLTVSLIAVLIPLLFMGDVVGRLFREFAVTLAVTIVISAVVSLTLVPMLCAKLLRRHRRPREQRGARSHGQRWFGALVGQYARMLDGVLDRQPLTLVVAVATLALTVVLYARDSERLFPGAGHRPDPRRSRRRRSGSRTRRWPSGSKRWRRPS